MLDIATANVVFKPLNARTQSYRVEFIFVFDKLLVFVSALVDIGINN